MQTCQVFRYSGRSSAFTVVFFNLLPFLFIFKLFSFFHLEVLSFSTSFVISVLFGDIEMKKNRLIQGYRQIQYRYIFRA